MPGSTVDYQPSSMRHKETKAHEASKIQAVDSRLQRKGPPSALHFVNVAVEGPSSSRPVRSSHDEASIRAHVMKDYLRQKTHPNESTKSPPTVSDLSGHVLRFRLSTPSKERPRRRGVKDADLKATRQRLHVLAPKGREQEGVEELVPARPLWNDLLYSVRPPIDVSIPGTGCLLDYYHHSYWDNSLAVNPEGQWMTVAISDPLMLHATLALVAQHKIQNHAGREMKTYFWHRGKTLRLISRNLSSSEQAVSDATVAAIAVLSAADNSVLWPPGTEVSHMDGLKMLVALRGGMINMQTNRHIRRVVVFADILHATTHDSMPQLGAMQRIEDQEIKKLMEFVGKTQDPEGMHVDLVPSHFQETFRYLGALAAAKTLFDENMTRSPQKLRLIYSDLLFATEHLLLGLGQEISPIRSAFGGISIEDIDSTIKAAVLIFTFSSLRDIAITSAVFDILVRRLRNGLSKTLTSLRSINSYDAHREPTTQPSNNTSQNYPALPLLLWLCLNGWMASSSSSLERRWPDRWIFVETAALMCTRFNITSAEELTSCIESVGCSTKPFLLDSQNLWMDIETWTWTGTALSGESSSSSDE